MHDDELAEMAAGFEMPVGFPCLGERKDAVDHRAQLLQGNGPVHCLEIGAAADADCATIMPLAVSNKESSPVPDGDRLVPSGRARSSR